MLGQSFLRANGVSADDYRYFSYTGTGFADDEAMKAEKPEEDGRIPGYSEGAARYVLRHGGAEGLRQLSRDKLPLAYWVVRFLQPGVKEEWKVLVDARRARVVAFVNPKEERAPAAGTVSPDSARRRALAAAAALGYPVKDYAVLDVGTRARPARVDTTVVLEAKPAGIGEARPRLTAVFHGARLAAFYPSLRIPEEFLRQYRKRVTSDWLLLTARIVAFGALIGIAIVLFLRAARRPDFRWRSLLAPLVLAAAAGALALANSAPSAMRQYQTEVPLSAFRVGVAASLLIVWIGLILAAGIGFVLFFAARPGWRRALRQGSLSDAFLRAAIAALGVAGLTHWFSVASVRWPVLFDPDPSLPEALERVVPGGAVLWSVMTATFALAAFAAVLAAARQDLVKQPVGLVLAGLALLLIVMPTTFRAPGEFLADLLPDVLVGLWIGLCAFLLLRDHPAAWIFFGALAYGSRAVLRAAGATGGERPFGRLVRPPHDRPGAWRRCCGSGGRGPHRSPRKSHENPGSGRGDQHLRGAFPPDWRAGLSGSGLGGGPRARAFLAGRTGGPDPAGVLGLPGDSQRRFRRRQHPPQRGLHPGDARASGGSRRGCSRSPARRPAVYGELRTPGRAPHGRLYAHYDGQPVDPARMDERALEAGAARRAPRGRRPTRSRWPAAGARFDPEWRLYARSASDDKAPDRRRARGARRARAPPASRSSVNLKFFLEGEEEAGSPHLAAMLARHRDALAGGPLAPLRRARAPDPPACRSSSARAA